MFSTFKGGGWRLSWCTAVFMAEALEKAELWAEQERLWEQRRAETEQTLQDHVAEPLWQPMAAYGWMAHRRLHVACLHRLEAEVGTAIARRSDSPEAAEREAALSAECAQLRLDIEAREAAGPSHS